MQASTDATGDAEVNRSSTGLNRPDSPIGQYRPIEGTFDELCLPDGSLRPHWRTLAEGLDAIDLDELRARWDKARRLIADGGIYFNVYADRANAMRPWDLDPLPWLITETEWSTIEAGLIQRAHLLDQVIADVYGSQRLLLERHLPPELVFGHSGFLRPCCDIRLPKGRHLHFYAVDLGRNERGEWVILQDWTKNPSGIGYALENRIVLSRVLSDSFQDHHVVRLATFFRHLRQMLIDLAPRHRDNPRVVLLTAGAEDPTYFEHAYISRYLGLPLVEGDDLTVRRGEVFLKTLGGLQPVDVIFRRINAEDCDPLELNERSTTGVAGLVQATRMNMVAVANSLGSSVAQNPALSAYVPALCEHILGEPLRLKNRRTWWLGDDASRRYVVDHLHELVVASWMPGVTLAPVDGRSLSPSARQSLINRIESQPAAYYACERVELSISPVFDGQGLQPCRTTLRAYVCAHADGYCVMPGGMARVMDPSNISALPADSGAGASKDTWVLSSRPVTAVSLLPAPDAPVRLQRGNDLPSRVADHLYWLGRYVERAESVIRLIRTIIGRTTDETRLSDLSELPPLLRVLTAEDADLANPPPRGRPLDQAVIEAQVLNAIFDDQTTSLRHWLNELRRVASVVRDRMSIDSWRILRRASETLAPPASDSMTPLSDVLVQLDEMVIALSAFSGLAMENTTRGNGWRFLDMGRRVERAYSTVRLLTGTLVYAIADERSLLQGLLETADSSMTYRARYMNVLHPAAVLDLLLTDDTNPRSLAYQIARTIEHILALPKEPLYPRGSPESRLLQRLLADVRLCDLDLLTEVTKPSRRRDALAGLLGRLARQVPEFSNMLSNDYLVHTDAEKQLTQLRLDDAL